MFQPEGVCMEHSGQCKAIETLENSNRDIFIRLHEVERTVWKAVGVSSVATAILVVVLEKVIK